MLTILHLRIRWLLLLFLLAAGLAQPVSAQTPTAPAALPPALDPLPPLTAETGESPRSLPGFVEVARRASPLLADLTNQARQIQVDSLRRKAQNGFQINGNGAAVAYPIVHNRQGEAVFGYDEAISNGGNYSAYAQVTKPILSGPLLQSDYRILGSQAQVLRNSVRLSALDLRRTITDQFLTAYAAQQQLTLSQELLTELRQQDATLRRLVDAGIFRQTQYLSFYLSLSAQEVAVAQNQLAYGRELGTLRVLAGVADTALVPLVAPAPPPRRPLAGLQSPAQRQYTLDSLRNIFDRQAVDMSYRPRLNLVADAGMQSTSYLPRALGRNVGVGAGVLLTLPIYDGHQRQLQYQRIELSERTRRSYRQFITGQRRQQFLQLENQLRAADALLIRIREQLRIAEALVNATHQQLATGDVLIFDYLTVVTSYRTLRFSLAQAETDRLRTLYALDYLAEQ